MMDWVYTFPKLDDFSIPHHYTVVIMAKGTSITIGLYGDDLHIFYHASNLLYPSLMGVYSIFTIFRMSSLVKSFLPPDRASIIDLVVSDNLLSTWAMVSAYPLLLTA